MTAVASRKLEKVLPPDKMDTSHTWSVGNVKESEEEVMMRQKRTGGKNKVVSHTELVREDIIGLVQGREHTSFANTHPTDPLSVMIRTRTGKIFSPTDRCRRQGTEDVRDCPEKAVPVTWS